MLGFPIRTPPDQRSVANSPGLIAGSNVLLRLLMPRHPPCALHSLSLTNTQQKQQTNNHTHASHTHAIIELVCATKTTHTPTPRPTGKPIRPKRLQGVCILIKQDARVHYPTINSSAYLSAGQPAQPHPVLIPSSFRRRGQETTTQLVLCDSSGPNSVSGPDQIQEASGSTPIPERMDSTEKHTRRPAGCSSTIPLASSTITTQPNAV